MGNRTQNSKDLDRFSPSMIQCYLNCPLAFYYRYLSGIELPSKQIHLLFGGAVHAGIEEHYKNKKGDPYKAFAMKFDRERLDDDEKSLFPEFTAMGHEMLTNYFKEHKTLAKLYNLDQGKSEHYVRRHLTNPLTGEVSTLPMSGIIDRLTKDGRIVEYKTSKKKWKEDAVDYKVQTQLYNLWFYSEFGELPLETLHIILLKKFKQSEKEQVVQVLSKHCTLDELAATFDEIELIISKIMSNQFTRPSYNHPRYCDCYKYEEALNLL